MDTSTPDLRSLAARVEKLERQNRLYKRFGLGLLLSVATLVAMGQGRPSRTIEAEQFILRDAQGRDRLTIGTPRVSGATVGMSPDDPAIWIGDRAVLTTDYLTFNDERRGGGYVTLGYQQASEPLIRIHDAEGFEATLGVDSLITTKTGEQHKTSAASLVLFGKGGKVLWSAP